MTGVMSDKSVVNRHLQFCIASVCLVLLISISPIKSTEEQLTTFEQQTGELSLMHNNEYRPPIIGVLTQVLRDYKRFTDKRHLHIASSYVKWIEASGAQVLPILLNQNDSYYERVFNQTNGLLLPGGDNLLDPHKDTPMMVAAKKLYKLAIEANKRGDHYPIWGTCLGLELLSVLTVNKNVLDDCSARDMSLPMNFESRGRLFAPTNILDLAPALDYSQTIMDALETKNLTYNHHKKCLTDASLDRAPELKSFYRPLAYSRDALGQKFIAIFEAIQFPFYGVQFHPEKPSFEFVVKKGQRAIDHSREAIAVSRYFGDFFIKSASKSKHRSADMQQLNLELIYAYSPMYTAIERDMYEQRYLFPYQNKKSITTEEFLDYSPEESEEAPEEVTPNQINGSQGIFEASKYRDGGSVLEDAETYMNRIEVLLAQARDKHQQHKNSQNLKLARL